MLPYCFIRDTFVTDIGKKYDKKRVSKCMMIKSGAISVEKIFLSIKDLFSLLNQNYFHSKMFLKRRFWKAFYTDTKQECAMTGQENNHQRSLALCSHVL